MSDNRKLLFPIKLVSVFLLVIWNVSAQQSFKQETSADIEIRSADWFSEDEVPNSPMRPLYCRVCPFQGENPIRNKKTGPLGVKRFIYRLELRNYGNKEIVSVIWQYNFLDPLTGKVQGKHKFTSRDRIKSGTRKTLSAKSCTPPTRTIDVKLLLRNKKNPYLEVIRVESVIYSDGSRKTNMKNSKSVLSGKKHF